jgi:hypothetical protein
LSALYYLLRNESNLIVQISSFDLIGSSLFSKFLRKRDSPTLRVVRAKLSVTRFALIRSHFTDYVKHQGQLSMNYKLTKRPVFYIGWSWLWLRWMLFRKGGKQLHPQNILLASCESSSTFIIQWERIDGLLGMVWVDWGNIGWMFSSCSMVVSASSVSDQFIVNGTLFFSWGTYPLFGLAPHLVLEQLPTLQTWGFLRFGVPALTLCLMDRTQIPNKSNAYGLTFTVSTTRVG